MTGHVERIRDSLSEIRTSAAAAQDLEEQGVVRALLEVIAREAERISAALDQLYDDAFVGTVATEPLAEDEVRLRTTVDLTDEDLP